ncbi:MAG TPA: hypothetical protein VFC30_02445 [Solirubrobacteraceae bacterium]|nr:hypothetical protein [Solirubrobacteraceae bacterium]
MERRPFPEWSVPAWRPALVALALASAGLPAGRAQAAVVAVDPLGAAAPVLWNGGVAWQDTEGVRAATVGSPPRRLVSFRPLGFTYDFSLDSGSGANGTATPGGGSSGGSGALAYGWEEANDMTPPMGPGDQNVATPPLPYETSIAHRGVIGADGQQTQLLACGKETEAQFFNAYFVSLAGATVAYICQGTPPEGKAPAGGVSPSYLALSDLTTPAIAPQSIAPVDPPFQLSGNYAAFNTGAPLGSSHIVVENRQTGTVSYEVPTSAQASSSTIALQEDGTLVLLGAGTSTCVAPNVRSQAPHPAEWFSPASPVAHQLGCFYDGSLRPVGGQWVALGPGPGTQALLELVNLATASSRTLAVFPNAGMFEPQPQSPPQQNAAPADFDGRQLAAGLGSGPRTKSASRALLVR